MEAVTTDNHSVSLANITVHYILQPIADISEQTELFCRFINDIVWIQNQQILVSDQLLIQYLRTMAKSLLFDKSAPMIAVALLSFWKNV